MHKIRKISIIVLASILILLLIMELLGYINKSEAAMSPENLAVISTPEQIESMEHPDFIVEEYIPWTPEGKNVAMNGKITVSSFADVYTGIKMIDGKTEGSSYWEADADEIPDVVTLDLKEEYMVHAIRLALNPAVVWGSRTQVLMVETSIDGENYEIISEEKGCSFDPATGNQVTFEFEEISCRYVRVTVFENTGSKGAQIAELEVYSE